MIQLQFASCLITIIFILYKPDMKKLFSLLVLSVALFSGCETKEGGDPKAVADKFIDAASRNDMPAVKNLTTIQSRFVLDRIESSVNPNGSVLKNVFNKDNVVTGKATISGDEAIVPVSDQKSGESMNLTLKKQLGEWKVSLDMNTLMEMAKGKMREKGISINDSLRKRIPSLDNLNIDSLSRKVRVNGKSIDSLRRDLKRRGISFDSLKKRNIEINF